MATQYLSPAGMLLQQLSNLGVPLAGGLVLITVAGSVSTLQNTYTDSTGLVLNANPLVLNSAGRLAANNAPVSIWVPANTPHRVTVTDSAGNLLSGGTALDNLYGINDPTSQNTNLANPATGFGADLVANAMRSYDVLASLRAANAPSLISGQTLVIDVEGGTFVNDSNGGIFYWDAASTASDDGSTVIKPNSILVGNPGRYLRQGNLFGSSGTFPVTVTGCTTSPVLTVTYVRNGNQIIASVPGSGNLTSNSTGFGLSGWPSQLRGINNGATTGLFGATDNAVLGLSAFGSIANQIGSTSMILTLNNATLTWTNSGTKAFQPFVFTYIAT